MRLVACRKCHGPTLIEGKLAITSPTYSEYRFSENVRTSTPSQHLS